MQCNLCGFVLGPFDNVCPRCQGKGLPTPPPAPVAPPAPIAPPPYPPAAIPSKTRALGLIVGVIFCFTALRFFFLASPPTTPNATVAPTSAPTRAPASNPTPRPIVPAPVIVPTSTPAPQTPATPEPNAPQSAQDQLRRINFSAYASSSLDKIRNSTSWKEEMDMALAFEDLGNDAAGARLKAPTQTEVLMWGSAQDMFGALSDAATRRAKYLSGDLPQSMLDLYERTTDQQITTSAKMADSYRRAAM